VSEELLALKPHCTLEIVAQDLGDMVSFDLKNVIQNTFTMKISRRFRINIFSKKGNHKQFFLHMLPGSMLLQLPLPELSESLFSTNHRTYQPQMSHFASGPYLVIASFMAFNCFGEITFADKKRLL
jgi:hypothetical protein